MKTSQKEFLGALLKLRDAAVNLENTFRALEEKDQEFVSQSMDKVLGSILGGALGAITGAPSHVHTVEFDPNQPLSEMN